MSRAALVKRINRVLVPQGTKLKKARGALARRNLGEYYVVNLTAALLPAVGMNVDLEKLGRELNVFHEGEALRDDA